MSPDPCSMSRLGLLLWALTQPYCFSTQYAPPRLTNKKCIGTPLKLFSNDGVEAISLIGCPISPTSNASFVVPTDNPVRYIGKLEKGKK